ncbi:MAG TPA: hypothetical protein PKE23_12410 [Anaerolineales bacterium]|nr:hypothetical protein [Anaerolineales bacterium]
MSDNPKNTGRFGKGNPGKPKGAINKTTADVRQAIAMLAESSAPKVQEWLQVVANDDPAKALDLWLKMIEYHIPKLARTELTGKDGGPVVIVATNDEENL